MSMKLIKPNKYETGFMHKRQEEFLIDSEADLALLPKDTQPGSVAWLADMSKSWKMSPNADWKEVVEAKGVTSWNDLEDKPFYAEQKLEVEEVLIERTVLSPASDPYYVLEGFENRSFVCGGCNFQVLRRLRSDLERRGVSV